MRAGINACVGVGQLGEARALLPTMRGAGMPPDLRAYNMLLKGASRGGDLPALDELLASLRSEVRSLRPEPLLQAPAAVQSIIHSM